MRRIGTTNLAVTAVSYLRLLAALYVTAPSVVIGFLSPAGAEIGIAGVKVVAKSEPATGRRRFAFRGISDLPDFYDPRVGATTLLVSEVNCAAGPPDELCVATATSGLIALDPARWQAAGKGYRYRDPTGSRGGVRAAVLGRSGRIVVKAVGDGWPLVPVGGGTGIQVRMTRDSFGYCADFAGGHQRNEAGWLSHRRSSPPVNCGGACGNGVVENGEGCDPPDGTTCDASCRSTCADDPGSTLVACSSGGDPTVAFAGNGDDFILAYTQAAPEEQRVRAIRLDALGQALDASPLVLSDGVIGASDPLAIVDDNGFYALWTSDGAAVGPRRRIPFSGTSLGPIDVPFTNGPPSGGMCDTYLGGPFGLGASLASGPPHFSWAQIAPCLGGWLQGVPGAGIDLSGPSAIADAPPAFFARSNSAVAAIWGRTVLSSPPSFSIQSNRIEPGPLPAPLQLTTIPSNVGALAVGATGELFLAVWSTPTQIRGLRFMFPNTLLDANGGFLIAGASGSAGLPAVASDGGRFVVAWRDRTASHDEVRAVHVGTDGVVVEPSPSLIASADTIADLGIAAGTSSKWVAFSTEESTGAHAMRIAPVP